MKTILCNEYQKNLILDDLAAKQGGVVCDTTCTTLAQVFQTEDSERSYVLSLQCMHLLMEHKESFPIFRAMFVYPQFIQEIMRFARDLVLYEVPLQDLPQTTPSEKELYGILALALTLRLSEKETVKNRDAKIAKLLAKEDLTIYESFESNLFHYHILEKLRAKDVPLTPLPKAKNPRKHLRFALNTRQELESIAQDIAAKQQEATVVLTSSQQVPVLKQVFARYNIPFALSEDRTIAHIPTIYAALLKFAHTKNKESFLECLRVDAFPIRCSFDLYTWLEQIMQDNLTMPQDIAKKIVDTPLYRDAQTIAQKEQSCAAFFASIEESYALLTSSHTTEEMIQNAYTVLTKSSYLKQQSELQAALKVRSFLQDVIPQVTSETDIAFLIENIQNISTRTHGHHVVTVTDLTHPLPYTKTAYIVGCHGKNYPAFPTKKGLFDEAYVKKVKSFPQLFQRYDMYQKQLEWIDFCGEDIYFSYATNDYQGRELQLAYDIEQKFDKETIRHTKKWPLERLSPFSRTDTHQLSPETAEKLFKKEGKIHGSISTIEKFFHCPYSYFIQQGLKVSTFQKNGLDAASIGDIQHAILEDGVKTNGKQYAQQLSEEEIAAVFQRYFEAYQLEYPNQAFLYDITKERLTSSFLSMQNFLEDMETNTSFVPTYAEYVFKDEDYFDGISLNGKIDRIDTTDFLFRILDYKSSSHSLSENSVKKGIQLQLLTYLLIARKQLGLTPVGCYYVNLAESNISIPAYHLSRNVVTPLEDDAQSQYQKMKNDHRLEGWTLTDRYETTNDQDGNFIKNSKKIYDIDLIEQCMKEVYQYFVSEISKGTISVEPDEAACTFCDYRSICRFRGQRADKPCVAMADTSLLAEKLDAEEDACH